MTAKKVIRIFGPIVVFTFAIGIAFHAANTQPFDWFTALLLGVLTESAISAAATMRNLGLKKELHD
jgi:hypothetical protein